jgi:hypothetical protein
MARLTVAWTVATGLALLAARPARAGEPADVTASPVRLALLAEPDDMPAPTETKVPAAAAATADPDDGPAGALSATGPSRPSDVSYGVAARLRWVTVPKWLLKTFTTENVPLSSWATAVEGFRRKGDFDFVVAVGYQNMTPPDGNWLGKGNDPATDTDFVQARGLGFIGIDASFVWHNWFSDWVGMHWGAGLGVALVTGTVYRTSNFTGGDSVCNDATAGNLAQCHPLGAMCTGAGCTLSPQTLTPGADDPANPHRFPDSNIPGVLPIINLVVGIDFRVPKVRGWEAKIEGGFYDAFFLGGGVGYSF